MSLVSGPVVSSPSTRSLRLTITLPGPLYPSLSRPQIILVDANVIQCSSDARRTRSNDKPDPPFVEFDHTVDFIRPMASKLAVLRQSGSIHTLDDSNDSLAHSEGERRAGIDMLSEAGSTFRFVWLCSI